MKQTTRMMVSAAAMVAVAGGIALTMERVHKSEEKETKQKEASAKVFDLEPARVRGMRLERGGAVIVSASRKGATGSWTLDAPLRTGGDDEALGRWVSALAGFKQKSVLEGDADPAQLGLAPPQLRATLRTDDGKELTLEVGSKNPFDGSVYVRRAGETQVRLADSEGAEGLDKTVFDLRDKRVLQVEPGAEVRSVAVSGLPVPYALELAGKTWNLIRPLREPADSGVALRLANQFKDLRATGVAAESAAGPALRAYGLDHPAATVQVETEAPGSQPVRRSVLLATAGQPAKTFAQRGDGGPVYEVDAQVLTDVRKTLFDLQDKALVRVAHDQVRRLEVAVPGQPVIAIVARPDPKADGGVAEEQYDVVAPSAGRGKAWKISGALFALSGLRAAAYWPAQAPAAGAPPPAALGDGPTYTLLGDGGRVLARVHLGADVPASTAADSPAGATDPPGKRTRVWVEGANHVAEVESSTLDPLPRTLADVLETPPPGAAKPAAAASHAPASGH